MCVNLISFLFPSWTEAACDYSELQKEKDLIHIIKRDAESEIEELKKQLIADRSELQFNTSYDILYQSIQTRFDILKEGCTSLPFLQKKELIDLCNDAKAAMTSELSKILNLKQMIEKCLSFKIPHELALTHPQCIQFLFESNVVEWILFFRNSGHNGPDNHDIRLADDGEPIFKFNGNWKTWKEIDTIVCYNKSLKKIVSRDNPKEIYSYISPKGFCPIDCSSYAEIFPIEQLTTSDYLKLLEKSKHFFNKNEEVDPGVEKPNIIQIITTAKDFGIPNTPITENLLQTTPRHVGIRIIDSERRVYSFGFNVKKGEKCINPFSVCKTMGARIQTPDCGELRTFLTKRVTSIPLSEERVSKIIEYVNMQNKNHLRFNFLTQNCSKFAEEVMALAGYRVSVKTAPSELIGRMLPKLDTIPYMGQPLSKLAKLISWKASEILGAFNAKVSQKLKNAASSISEKIMHVTRKIQSISLNILIMSFGGTQMHSPLPPEAEDNTDNENRLTTFSSLIRNPIDLFSKELFKLKHPLHIVDWQDNQDSTTIYNNYEGQKLYL